MQCPACDTPLWKVRQRRCPSCERPFKPSDFRFRPQTVRFCCPHCEQGYLGAGADGLPSPRRFECAFCGRWIDADEMVLEVAEGVAEHETRPDELAWIETHRPWPMRWALTAWLGVRDPAQLLRLTPIGLGTRPVVRYALVTLGAGALVVRAVAWIAGVGLSLPAISRSVTSGPGLLTLLLVLLGTGAMGVAWVAIIGAAAPPDDRPSVRARATQAVGLTCMPHLLWFVPGVGLWIGWLGTLAWVRSAWLALGAADSASSPRVRRTAVIWPVACLAVWGLLGAGSLLGVLPRFGPGPSSWTASPTAAVGRFDAPIRDALARGQRLTHPAELMADGVLRPSDFCAPGSQTTPAGVSLSGSTLDAFEALAPARQLALIQQAAEGPPRPARRLGDFVFIQDTMNLDDPGLWVVVEAPDPAHNPSGGPIHALYRDGSVRTISEGEVVRVLRDQNRLRVRHALPTLHDPRTVRGEDAGG